MSNEEILSLIKNSDKTFISKCEKEHNCTYELKVLKYHKRDSLWFKTLKNSWNFPEDDYYVVIGNPRSQYFDENDSRAAGYELNYMFSVDNKNIISVNHQGGTEEYVIENDRVVTIYLYK